MSTCTIPGDGDLYGIGVRLGLYLQWLAGFLLRNMDGTWKTISLVRTANTALSTALNLCVVINAVRGVGSPIDYLVVYYLTIALFYSESYNLMRKNNTASVESNDGEPREADSSTQSRWLSVDRMLRRSEKPGYYYDLYPDVALVAQNVLFASATLFGTWFWIRGVFGFAGSSSQCGGDAKGALLGVFNLFDERWRRFAAAFSIMSGLLLVLILLIQIVYLSLLGPLDGPVGKGALLVLTGLDPIKGSRRKGPKVREAKGSIHHLFRPRLSLKSTYQEGGWPRLLLLVFHWFVMNLLGPLLAITSVERMLIANRVSTPALLESSGQMIALLSGIMSFCMAVWDIVRPAAETSDIDLLEWYMYMARRPLSKEEMEKALKNLKKAVDEYDTFPQYIRRQQQARGDTPRGPEWGETQRHLRPAPTENGSGSQALPTNTMQPPPRASN